MEEQKEEILEEVEKEVKTSKKEEKKAKKDEIQKLKEEINGLKENYLKSVAELENFKKRTNEERIKERKYGSSNLVHDLLTPLEQFRKVVSMETDDSKLKNFLIGFKMINDNIYQVLEQDGLKEIKINNNEFDPNYHYAVEKVSDKEKANGSIVEVIQTGYMYKDRILRPTMVKVNEWSEQNEQDK